MSMSRKLQKKLFHKLLYSALALSVLSTGTAYAEEGMPQGGSVVTETAPTGFSANPVSGAAMTATANTLINWDSFNLGTGKTLTLDPNGFVFMHQVTGASQSEIQGILNGGTSGHLILANPHGIIINGATINADRLTLTTMQNLDATGFSKLTSGGWGPEVNTNDQIVGITNSTIGVKHYLGVLAGVIMLADHVTVNTENSTIDLTAVKNGQYSLLMGRDAFYSNGVQYTNASNSIKIGDNTVLNVNGNSYNSIHILGGQVGIGDYAQLNTGSDPNMSNVLVEAVATKNDSESDPDKMYTASEDNLIHMGLVSFSNGSFALVGGNLTGETESFQEKFTKVGGETPTPPGPTPPEPPGPTPPGPTPPEPGSLTPEQKAQAHETANNLLDSAMNNDALKALQEAVSGSQKNGESSDYVTVQSGAEQNTGLNITKGLEGLTVQEAAARVRSIAKDYMKALNAGDKAKADQFKEALKEANRTVKVLKEQEKLTKEEKEKAEKVTQPPQDDDAAKATKEAYEKALKDAQEAAKKVEEARAKAELAARDYLNALKTGDPEIIAAYKERLQEANDAYLAARQNEEAQIKNASNPYTIGGVYNNLTGTPEPGQQGGEQQDNSAESGGFPSLSELVRQYQEQQQQQQQSGETTIVTVGEPQESDALKRINDLIGKELIERETNARNKLVKAKTSEERQQAMKELDEIHRLETEKVQKAQAEQKYNDIDKEFFKLQKDVDQAAADYTDAKERGASQEELDRLGAKFEELSNEQRRILDEKDAAEAKLEAARAQQGEQQSQSQQAEQQNQSQAVMEREWLNDRNVEKELTDSERESIRQIAEQEALELMEWEEKERAKAEQQNQSQQGGVTSVAETGGQSGLNIGGGERPVVETETTRPRTGTSQQTVKLSETQLEQKYDELYKKTRDLDNEKANASLNYQDAKEAGANPEELARLQAEYDRLDKERDAVYKEQEAAKSELSALRDQQAAKDAAVKAAQEKLDQSRKDGFDKYAALQKAQYDLSAAEDKAEQAANDYLLALKSGDKDTIAAFKEELQKANDALLEAKRNEEAAQQGLKEAGSNIARAQTELNNAQNNFNDSGAAGGETQQTTQQAVEQPTQQQTVEQQSQSQQGEQRTSVVETGGQSDLNIGGGERPVVETETTRPRTGTSQQTTQEKVSVLEQKYKELDETVGKLVSDITAADVAYMKAEDAGASQEELDRLKAERAQIANKRDAIWEERAATEAELKDAKAQQSAQQNG